MIVLDASALVELLLGTKSGRALEDLRALDTVLLTCDARLARAPGLSRRVELVR